MFLYLEAHTQRQVGFDTVVVVAAVVAAAHVVIAVDISDQ